MRAAYLSLAAASLAAFGGLMACAEAGEPSSTPAAASQGGGRQCFRPRQVNGFNAVGDDVVYLRVGASHIYRAEILGTCPDIDFTHRVGIRSRTGAPWICQGLDAEFIVPGPGRVESCPITSLRKLTDAEAQAYREQPPD